jgi:hypothetical protein
LKRFFEKPSKDVQQRVNAFAQLDNEYYSRGIERYLNKHHDRERVVLKQRSIQGVLSHQRNMKLQGRLSPIELADELSILEHEYSVFARKFARHTGIADELVVNQGEDPRKARQLSHQLLLAEDNQKRLITRWNSSDSISANSSCQARRPKRRGSDSSIQVVMEQDLLDETSEEMDLQQQDSWRTLEHSGGDSNAKIIRECPQSPACPLEEIIRASNEHLMASPA